MINVVCVKFGTKYGPEYVNRLFYAVRRNLTLPFKFHCFTEFPQKIHSDIIIHPLQKHREFEGWWHKLYLFSPEMPIEGRIFYLDLDTLITGNIDDIASYNQGFVVLHDFFLIRLPNRKDKWGTGKTAVGSGVLSFDAHKHTQIWETFIQNPGKAVRSLSPHGDQRWIQQHQKERLYWQDLFPNQLVSFKVHCRSGLPKNARIVCYHGRPSIPESINTTTKVQGYTIKPTKWILKHWHDETENSTTDTSGKSPSETNRTSEGSTETQGRAKVKGASGSQDNKAQKKATDPTFRRQQLRVASRRRNRKQV